MNNSVIDEFPSSLTPLMKIKYYIGYALCAVIPRYLFNVHNWSQLTTLPIHVLIGGGEGIYMEDAADKMLAMKRF